MNCLLYGQDYEYYKTLGNHDNSITDVTFRQEDYSLVSGDKVGQIILWNVESGQKIKALNGHTEKITDLTFSNDGKYMASASYDGTVKIWNTNNWSLKKTLTTHKIRGYSGYKGNEPTFVVFTPDSKKILFGGYNMTIEKANIENGTKETIFSSREGAITSGIISNDGEFLVFGSLGNIRFIKLNDNSIHKTIKKSNNFNDFVCEVVFNPITDDFYYWAYNGFIHTYKSDYSYKESLKATTAKGTSNIFYLMDGETYITGNDGNKTHIRKGNEILQILEKHQAAVTTFTASNEGKYIITGSEDKSIIVWKKERERPEEESETVNVQHTFTTDKRTVELYIWDYAQIDGDTISLVLGNQTLIANHGLNRNKLKIEINLVNGNNYVVMNAHNLGEIPPNTAALMIKDGTKTEVFRLKSNLQSSGAINIKLE
jgi:WD40 repeat protein